MCIPYPCFHVIASEAKQSHECFFPPRLLRHCVPRNDEREGNIDDLLNVEKEGCVTKVVDEYMRLMLPITYDTMAHGFTSQRSG